MLIYLLVSHYNRLACRIKINLANACCQGVLDIVTKAKNKGKLVNKDKTAQRLDAAVFFGCPFQTAMFLDSHVEHMDWCHLLNSLMGISLAPPPPQGISATI